MQCKVLRIRSLVTDIPIESVLQANVVNLYIQLEGFDATRDLRLVGAIARNSLADGVLDVAFKMSQSGILRDDKPRKLLWSEVWVIDVPAKLLFVAFPF